MKLVNLSEFAKLLQLNKSTVTRYKQSGRLVMAGKLVDVEASEQRIKDTADPNRDDVVKRNAEKKGMPIDIGDSVGNSYQAARAKKEKYLALQAKADYEKNIGLLVERSEVERDWITVANVMRLALERIPDFLSAELAVEGDTNRINAMLVEHIESVLKQAADRIREIQ